MQKYSKEMIRECHTTSETFLRDGQYYLLEWAIASHGRVLILFLQMNTTYHNSTFITLNK